MHKSQTYYVHIRYPDLPTPSMWGTMFPALARKIVSEDKSWSAELSDTEAITCQSW